MTPTLQEPQLHDTQMYHYFPQDNEENPEDTYRPPVIAPSGMATGRWLKDRAQEGAVDLTQLEIMTQQEFIQRVKKIWGDN